MVTIVTPALHTDLTTPANLQAELGSTVDASRLARAIKAASSAVELHCGRIFARQGYRELLAGYGTTKLQLREYPVLRVPVPVVAVDGAAVEDFVVEDRLGQLVRAAGWSWTVAGSQGLTLQPIPDSEALDIQADYTAGYLLPSDDLVGATGISVVASDKSYNDPSGRFPLLVAGDRFEVTGYTDAANNGTRTVVSRTASKITVAETLVDEVAPATATLLFSNLPAAIEDACIEIAKADLAAKGVDPSIGSLSIGKLSITYDRSGSAAIPGLAAGKLVPFERWA